MTQLEHLKVKITTLEESIKQLIITLNNKKTKVTLEEKLGLKDKYDRLKKLHQELREWGKFNRVIQVEIEIWEKQFPLKGISQKKTYLVYYTAVTQEEAKELVAVHFPGATIKQVTPIQTGTKITKK